MSLATIGCFVASVRGGRLRPDYVVYSPAWEAETPRQIGIPSESLARQCSAIGFIARGTEAWVLDEKSRVLNIQAVGLPPYQGGSQPRVAGLIRPESGREIQVRSVQYVVGDVLQPQGTGKKVIAHIVNDATPRWGGGGFASVLRKTWPKIQDDFKHWTFENKEQFRLGATRVSEHDDEVSVMSMVAQHGYGPSERPRIRYSAVEKCLDDLAQYATKGKRSIHMPKIGTGYGGGNWAVIEELIEKQLCASRLDVRVYQLRQ